MKNLTYVSGFVAACFVVLFGLNSCMDCIEGEGEVVWGEQETSEFNKLEVSVPAEVFLIPGSQPSVEIEAQENIIQAVLAETRGRTLVLKTSQCVRTNEVFRIRVTINELSAISVNGSGSVFASQDLEVDNMDLKINGSGDIRMTIVANRIEAGINGSGDIKLSGTTGDIRVKVNGSGDLKGVDLQSQDAVVNINGSGDVDLSVSEMLDVTISGSGNVNYSGNPKVNSTVRGSGEVSGMN